MIETTLQQRMTTVRSMCKEFFYMVSPYVEDKEQAEKLAQVLAKNQMKQNIDLHNKFITLCDKSNEYKSYWKKAYDTGIQAANGARKKTHEDDIKDLTKNIEVIDTHVL